MLDGMDTQQVAFGSIERCNPQPNNVGLPSVNFYFREIDSELPGIILELRSLTLGFLTQLDWISLCFPLPAE